MSHIPALGPRGEGWLALQLTLLGAVVLASFLFPGAWPSGLEPAPRVVGAGFILVGIIVFGVAVRALGSSLSPFPQPAPGAVLVVDGPFRWIRHPIYSGLLAAAAGGAIYTGSLVAALFAVALAVVLDLKARREELWLRDRYPGYAPYLLRTKRFVPGLY